MGKSQKAAGPVNRRMYFLVGAVLFVAGEAWSLLVTPHAWWWQAVRFCVLFAAVGFLMLSLVLRGE